MAEESKKGKKRLLEDLVALHQSIVAEGELPPRHQASAASPSASAQAALPVADEEDMDAYERFFEHLPVGVLLADVQRDRYRRPEGVTPIKVNMTYARLIGLARVTILEQDFFEVLPGGRADWQESLITVAGKGRVARGMAYWESTDVHLEMTLFMPRRNLLAVMIEDASRTVQANASSTAHEQALDAMLRATPELVCRFRPDGSLTYANRAYCEFFKKVRDELVGHNFLPEIPLKEVDWVRGQLSVLNRDRRTVTYQHRFDVDGVERWVEWTDIALFDDEGALTEYLAFGRDVTRQRRHTLETERVAGFMEDLLEHRTHAHTAAASEASEQARSSEALTGEVNSLHQEVKRLRSGTVTGELEVCSTCNRIHDAEGHWLVVPMFLETHTAARVVQEVCPYCRRKAQRDMERKRR